MSDEMQSIAGVVTRVFTAKLNDEGAWMPGKLIVLTDDGEEVDFIAWPMKDYETKVVFEPMRMPPWFAALDLETLEGASVRAIAVPRISAYSGKVEFIKVNSFKVAVQTQDGTPPPSPTPTPTQSTFSLDERIAWNSSVNNSVTVLASEIAEAMRALAEGDESSLDECLGRVDRLASGFYDMIRRGPVEPAVEEAEQEDAPLFSDEAPDLPSLGSV